MEEQRRSGATPNEPAKKRRLKVSRETLTRLGDAAMRRAAGGTQYDTIVFPCTVDDPSCMTCPSDCPPCDSDLCTITNCMPSCVTCCPSVCQPSCITCCDPTCVGC